MKGRPIEQLVYEAMLPRPKASDPHNFHGILTRYLVYEVRQEVHSFYGHLNDEESKYPGLDYCHPVHRIRLSRWQWHRRLFRAFDALRLTPAEIASLTKWEGTKWAKERYEKEQGITIRDTAADDIPDWSAPGSRRPANRPTAAAPALSSPPEGEESKDAPLSTYPPLSSEHQWQMLGLDEDMQETDDAVNNADEDGAEDAMEEEERGDHEDYEAHEEGDDEDEEYEDEDDDGEHGEHEDDLEGGVESDDEHATEGGGSGSSSSNRRTEAGAADLGANSATSHSVARTGDGPEDSDEDVQSIGIALNERLRERVAAHNAGDTSQPLDDDWEQWLKNVLEAGNMDLVAEHIANLYSNPLQNRPSGPRTAIGFSATAAGSSGVTSAPLMAARPGQRPGVSERNTSELPNFIHEMIRRNSEHRRVSRRTTQTSQASQTSHTSTLSATLSPSTSFSSTASTASSTATSSTAVSNLPTPNNSATATPSTTSTRAASHHWHHAFSNMRLPANDTM